MTSGPIIEPGGARLYVDTSALLTRLLAQAGRAHVDDTVRAWLDRGGILVSSRLLWLESARVTVRERLLGNEIGAAVTANLATIARLPVTDEIWGAAASMEQHVRTLDALHLATCEAVGATLLSCDGRLRDAAAARGTAIV